MEGLVLPQIILLLAFGAIANKCALRKPVPSMSGASPLSSASLREVSSACFFMFLNIDKFCPLAKALAKGMFLLWRYEWKPIVPNPILRSRIAEYLARCKLSLALLIKYSKTLSRNLTTSGMKLLSSFHSSYFSKLSEDKQHTAVRSSFVGNVISLHKFE